QKLRLLQHKAAVEEEQTLQWRVRINSPFTRTVGIGKIKQSQRAIELSATDKTINSATVILFLGQTDWFSTHSEIQIPGDVENGVPQGLDIEPFAISAPEQPIVRLDAKILILVFRAQGIRR